MMNNWDKWWKLITRNTTPELASQITGNLVLLREKEYDTLMDTLPISQQRAIRYDIREACEVCLPALNRRIKRTTNPALLAELTEHQQYIYHTYNGLIKYDYRRTR